MAASKLVLIKSNCSPTLNGLQLLSGVLNAARSIVPSVENIAQVAAAGSKDLDAAALLLTTQSQVEQTVAGVANYGGSLDVIVDDDPRGR